MYYCGLNVSIKSTHVCIDDARGRRVLQSAVTTTAEAIRMSAIPSCRHRSLVGVPLSAWRRVSCSP